MTVIATMLAGLASSEMTKAQYDRSLAAQQQSKAGDQWSFFQAKRLRGAFQRNTLDLLQASNEVHPLDVAALQQTLASPDTGRGEVATLLGSAAGQRALGLLQRGELPAGFAPAAPVANIKAALAAIDEMKPETEVAALLAAISHADLLAALLVGRTQTDALDDATRPVNQLIEALDRSLPGQGSGAGLNRDFIAARLRFSALRYEAEARLNQVIANLYELQVRKNNLSAERHHGRSQRFFYGMLGAQMAVIIATFAVAAKQRNLLWSLAAAAGVGALLFASYVFLFV